MLDDPIVEEIHKIREAYAKRFNYDLQAMVADLMKQEAAGGRKVVSFPPRKPVMVQLRQRAETAVADEKGAYKAEK
jgi:hypothetical protein